TNLGMVRGTPDCLPPAKAGHPPTLVRCASMTAGYPSEEPIAGKPHDGICGGESQQWLSYPTTSLDPYYDRVAAMLEVAPLPPERTFVKRDRFRAAAAAIGHEV